MTQLVAYCNHWIGFHIVEDLLENGYEVNGIDDQNKTDMLTMFFGRNSLFRNVNKATKVDYENAIFSNGEMGLNTIKSQRALIINPDKQRKRNPGETYIYTPLLYGEWMPMNEKGIYQGEKIIPFNSSLFQNKAVYIKEFTTSLIQCLEVRELSPTIHMKIKESDKNKNEKIENCIYIRDNISMKKRIDQVVAHYNQYKDFYDHS